MIAIVGITLETVGTVVVTAEVTEVEEAEVVVGLEWPGVDTGDVVAETTVENVLASEVLVIGEVVAIVDVEGVLD